MGLKREEHPCWVAECDGCGECDNDDYGGSYHHPDEQTARERLDATDWTFMPDGRLLCLECFDAAREET